MQGRLLARIADTNQRVIDRARGVLNPDQLKSLQDFQTQQLEMQKFGMKMAAKMFGDSEGDAQPPVVAPAN